GDAEDTRPAIWIHAVSVGETMAAQPLVKALRERFPNHRLIVSTTTATGQQVARARLEADGFCYFPFDWRFSVRRALNRVRPQAVVLMESELWPNFLRACRKRNISVIVANGRISDRSFTRSQKLGFLIGSLQRKMIENVTHFAMQSEADAERILALGASESQVSVSGNIKYDIGTNTADPSSEQVAERLNSLFGLMQSPLIIAGSTSDGEEEIILSAFEKLKKDTDTENVRLLIAPRHPERFDAVARILESSRLRYVRRSTIAQQTEVSASTPVSNLGTAEVVIQDKACLKSDVILLDSIGELAALYRYASVVFIGGSLMPKGGHNILEPALYAKPIIVGPHMENFREITEEFLRRDGVIQLGTGKDEEFAEALFNVFNELLNDEERARTLGQNAQHAVRSNQGATAHTVEVIANSL
ncbi:MAG TPA: 3-deoxy-D-manno-octulosonic acid transferase, partial [Blastocatellia bacterium]|nr:3-deoxy-D-manno-octulosonic acid transferase [Blastocatellia bacterium]